MSAEVDKNRYTCYVVEWDIPKEPIRLRAQFYRRLRKIRHEWEVDLSLEEAMNRNTCNISPDKVEAPSRFSTMSVLITAHKDLAWEVWELARSYGRAHLYEAHQLE